MTQGPEPPPDAPELIAERPLPEEFAAEEATAVRDAISGTGMSFNGNGPSPFARGYAAGLLRDVARHEAAFDDVRRLASLVLGDDAPPQSWKSVGCETLAREGEGRQACRLGMTAYRIRRDLELEADRPAYIAARLRSVQARTLFEWAKDRLPSGPPTSPLGRSIGTIQDGLRTGAPPNAAEREAWRSMIGMLMR